MVENVFYRTAGVKEKDWESWDGTGLRRWVNLGKIVAIYGASD
jgi:3-deoxy-D-manno-octulosonate 8-phosphate phosphatase KdsC-like HAD superfamily phosphatase